jgi:hypothetical protein
MSQLRRLQFGLRAVLMVTTVAAVASWVYWIGWDRWRWHLQKKSLLEQVARLPLGEPMTADWRPTIAGSPPPFIISGSGYSQGGIYFKHVACRWPDELYVVLIRYEDSCSAGIEVFALRSAPKDYEDAARTA